MISKAWDRRTAVNREISEERPYDSQFEYWGYIHVSCCCGVKIEIIFNRH